MASTQRYIQQNADRGGTVLVLECDSAPFRRATFINQARVHQGYHYPRSISTAMKSAGYFARFHKDFSFCINKEFKQVYATSEHYSWTSGNQFKEFCGAAEIPCEELAPSHFFKPDMCDGAFLTREYTYDAMILKDWFLDQISNYPQVKMEYGVNITKIEHDSDSFHIVLSDGREYTTGYLLNATYAGAYSGSSDHAFRYELIRLSGCN